MVGERKRVDRFFSYWGGQAIPEETLDERVGQPRREKREESFMPVEITGAWEKGIGGRIVLGWFAPGLKPRPPKERRRRADPKAKGA